MENTTAEIPVTDEHRKLVFSFIHTIRSLKTSDPSRMDSIIRLLGDEFDVDPAGLGGSNDSGVDLYDVFRTALNKVNAQESDEKFKSFIELLTKKGYFKDADVGTAEYESRLEKAKLKFDKRSNPYDGMSAEALKSKGNELMGQAKYREAIAYYSKAIELEPENHIFFANRAAAHTHLKDYRSAIIDCERAIAINPSYSKAYSRMGTSFFYQENYARAVDAFSKACELEPNNERYKEDLKQAEERSKLGGGAASLWGGGGGFGGAPGGMPDFSQITKMMGDPQFANTVQNMMQNPQFSQLVTNMMGRFAGGDASPERLLQLMNGGGGGLQVSDEGEVMTPFGNLNRDALEKLKAEQMENPKFRAIVEDIQTNGFSAFQKYMGDPDVMDLMLKFQNVMMASDNASPSSSTGN